MPMTLLKPQEIFLLERYTSLEYFGMLRDRWGEMIAHLERCLAQFLAGLPSAPRALRRLDRSDIVWSDRVIPNFQRTFMGLCAGYIALSHDEADALEYSYGPLSDLKGQMDYSSSWMSREDDNTYENLLHSSVEMASNIVATIGANWDMGHLAEDYSAPSRGVLDALAVWPAYQLANNIVVDSGAAIATPGIYLPDVDNSCAQFLYAGAGPAPEASVRTGFRDLLHPVTGAKYGEDAIIENVPCRWTLVERGPGTKWLMA